MEENLCDEIAHRAGFVVPIGNWITPGGALIVGKNYTTHHWETIKKYLNIEDDINDNLRYMNDIIIEGYIRIIIRFDMLFQVHGDINVVWSDAPNFVRMRDILDKLGNTEIHIFSKTFYMVGFAEDICKKAKNRLQIKQ